jgi:hypothetical protein
MDIESAQKNYMSNKRSATVSFGLGQAIRFTSPSSMANPRDALSELSVLGVKVVVVTI